MTQDPLETLSAFIDGEPVEPLILAQALSEPGAREALRDYAFLRAELLADDARPGAAFYRKMDSLLEPPVQRRRWWTGIVPVPAPALAAAAVLVLILGGWALRSSSRSASHASELPPTPDRVVVFQPGVDWEPRSGSASEPSLTK